jgi:hypothetical protein
MYGKSSCEMSGPYVCGMVGGKPKASFCEAGGNFCPYIMMQTMTSCGSDADCKKDICCSSLKKMMTDACDGMDSAKLDLMIKDTKAGGQCADSNCNGESAGTATRAGAPYLHHQYFLTHFPTSL